MCKQAVLKVESINTKKKGFHKYGLRLYPTYTPATTYVQNATRLFHLISIDASLIGGGSL
jgi:hypothetical protein